MRSSRAPRPRVRAPVVLSVAVALAAASVAAAASAASALPGLSPDVLVVGDVALARVEARRRSAAVDAARDAPEQTAARDGEAEEPPGEDPGAASNARGAEVDHDHDHHHDHHHHHHHDHDHHHDHRRRHDPAGETDASSRPWTLRAQALLASLATSCVSLVTLALFPFVANRRASEDEASAESRAARVRVVALALSAFGAGALLGDAFLHQLPHAYAFAAAEENKKYHGEGENHHHHHHGDHRDDFLGEAHLHSRSVLGVGSFLSALRAQRVGLAAVAGVAAFYFVERAVERSRAAGGGCARHGAHRTGAGSERERAAENASGGDGVVASGDHLSDGGGGGFLSSDDDAAAGNSNSRARSRSRTVKKRRSSASAVSPRRASPAAAKRGVGARGTRRGAAVASESPPPRAKTGGRSDRSDLSKDLSKPPPLAPAAVLNLLADAAHNFFDGVSLGVAFLAGGSVAGWRAAAATVAHELPQEVGDYGVLVASGCDPLRAIALNFLSALASLLGTLVALAAHRSVGGAEGSAGVGGGGEMGDFFLGFDRGVADAFVAGGFVFLAAGSAFGEASKATRGVWDEALVAACVALGVGACAATHAGGGCEHRHG